MNPYLGNFAPQADSMAAQQAPQMAPGNQQLNYQQQMAQALMNQPQGGANGMPNLTGVMDMMNKFKQMQQPAPIMPAQNTTPPTTMNSGLPPMMA